MGYQKQNDDETEWFKKEIERRLKEKNTDIFQVMKRIKPLIEVLCHQSEGTLFLNREDFKTLYPVFLSKSFKNSKMNLIVSADVLLDEKQETENQFFFCLNNQYIQQQTKKKPSLSRIPAQERVFVAATDIQCDSFMIFNDRSYIMKINKTEEPYFSCSLNAAFDINQSKRLTILSHAMQKIKSVAVTYQSVQRKVASQNRTLKNRLGGNYERE